MKIHLPIRIPHTCRQPLSAQIGERYFTSRCFLFMFSPTPWATIHTPYHPTPSMLLWYSSTERREMQCYPYMERCINAKCNTRIYRISLAPPSHPPIISLTLRQSLKFKCYPRRDYHRSFHHLETSEAHSLTRRNHLGVAKFRFQMDWLWLNDLNLTNS